MKYRVIEEKQLYVCHSNFLLGSKVSLRDSARCLTLDEVQCAENLVEHKIVLIFCLLKSIVQYVIYTFSILQRTLFTLSSLCVLRLMQCSLSLLHGEGPFLSSLCFCDDHHLNGIWQLLTVADSEGKKGPL